MNILDRAISVFSPERGLRRASARAMLDQYRIYAAAGSGRRNKGWRARSTSANNEVGSSLRTLRDRSREFVRDSWAGQRILDVLTGHVVGTGIQIVPNSGSDRVDNRFRSVWNEWQEVADIEGVMNFGAMQALAFRSMVEGGESVIRHIEIERKDAGRTVPLRLLGLEGDLIDDSRDSAIDGVETRLGVSLGDWGKRRGLWLWSDHPGEARLAMLWHQSRLCAWEELTHLYRPLRFGQIRGITWFAPILLTGREIQDLTEAAIVKERTQASFAGFLKRQPGGTSPFATKKDEAGAPVTRIEPGMIADIGESDIVFAQPSGQSSFAEAYVAGMRAMAAGAGVTYDQLTGDTSKANYSSMKGTRIEFRRLVEQCQWHIMAERFVLPVARRVTDRAVLAGLLPVRRGGYPVDLVMPANEPIDPKKDLEADILACRSGRLSPQEFISAWGQDWRKVVADYQAFLKTIDNAGVVLDIDPRRSPAKEKANAPIEP